MEKQRPGRTVQKDAVRAGYLSFFTKLFLHLVTLLLLGGTLWASMLSASSHKPPAERFYFLILAMIGGFCVAVCVIKLYLPVLTGKVIDSLFSPKRYLKKSAPLLSHPRNLILQKEYFEAEKVLLELLEEYPADCTITLMLLEMYVLKTGQNHKGELLCRQFFNSKTRYVTPLNLKILLLYTDILASDGRLQEASEILLKEKENKIYPAEDLLSMEKRWINLQERIKQEE